MVRHRTFSGFAAASAVCLSLFLPARSLAQGEGQECYLPPEIFLQEGAGAGTDWTNGVVPYRFDAAVTAPQQASIIKALSEMEAVCGIDFVPRTNQANFITVRPNPGTGCDPASCSISSAVGMAGGEQFISVGSDRWNDIFHLCHEFCHALGYLHEQQRPDRDNFVTVNFAQVSQTACGGSCNGNFNISLGATMYGPYDYTSFMHYNDFAFAIGGIPTITTDDPAFQNIIGQRQYMSAGDANMLQARYGAPSAPTISSMIPSQAFVGAGPVVVTINGTLFYDGSPSNLGVQGTRVRWDGAIVAGTWVTPTQFQFTATQSMLDTPGCITVQIENPAPAGGLSNAVTFNVLSLAPVVGRFYGLLPGEQRGAAVVGLGDVNNDGYDDIAVSAPEYLSGDGEVICYSGATSQLLWVSTGTVDSAHGTALANLGDINNDGVNDLIVGAPEHSNSRGRVQVLDGTNGNALLTFLGAANGDEYGYAVAAAGDMNGDGTPDLLVGAPGANADTGTAYAFSGTNGALLNTYGGSEAGERMGASVAGGADFNGDGIPEVAVGAPNFGASNNGRVRLYISPAGIFYTATGSGPQDQLGTSLTVLPYSVDAAGAAVVAGAPEAGDLFGNDAGPGYVRAYRVGLGTLDQVMQAVGSEAGDRFGRSVALAGDLDQDGWMDVVVGADEAGVGLLGTGSGPGYVRALSGEDFAALGSHTGEVNNERFGRSVAAAGDFDADGRFEVIVGSPLSDERCDNAGLARIVDFNRRPEWRKLMITEVTTGNVDGVEVTNFDTVTRSLSGWRVTWKDGATTVSGTLSGSLAPGRSIIIRDSAGTYPETPVGTTTLTTFTGNIPTQTGDCVVALLSPRGVVADEVRIASSSATYTEGTLGSPFRGLATRTAGSLGGSLERIWGLDSNSGADWTEQFASSMGLENRSSGPRGTDPLPVPVVRITEVDDSPDYVELRNGGIATLDLQHWTLLASAGQNTEHTEIRPFPNPLAWASGNFLVIGDDATAPAEIPLGVPYVNLQAVAGGNLPMVSAEFSLALYDSYGRLIDAVRTTATSGPIVHNHPRAPSHPQDFTGAAPRFAPGTVAVARISTTQDSHVGSDWQAVTNRTMGSNNAGGGFTGSVGIGTAAGPFGVRVNDTAAGQGLTIIMNGGSTMAGQAWSFTFSGGHLGGTGPVFGLGLDAIDNYLTLSTTPPWFGILDVDGSARLDAPPGIAPAGIQVDAIFIVLNGGAIAAQTAVLEFDT